VTGGIPLSTNTPNLDELENAPLGPMPLWEQHWPSFATALCEKLARGHGEYGDKSFERDPAELLGEIREELLDVCGWAYIMLVKLKALEGGGA